MTADERQDTLDQLLALEIHQFVERDRTAEVLRLIGVAARAVQRAAPSDLNREQRPLTTENLVPRRYHCRWLHPSRLSSRKIHSSGYQLEAPPWLTVAAT